MLRLAERPVVQLGLALAAATAALPVSEEFRAVQAIIAEMGQLAAECRSVDPVDAAIALVDKLREEQAELCEYVEGYKFAPGPLIGNVPG